MAEALNPDDGVRKPWRGRENTVFFVDYASPWSPEI